MADAAAEDVKYRIPVPMCLVSPEGKVVSANRLIDRVFLYGEIEDSDFFALTGRRLEDLVHREPGSVIIERNGRKFAMFPEAVREEGRDMYMVFFRDVTDYEELKERYGNEKLCIARVNIDNYDEFTGQVSPENGMSVTAEVDRLIRAWAAQLDASIDKIRDTQYTIYFQGRHLPELERGKFALLDQVRAIESGADFPLSLSIGVGVGGKEFSDTAEHANAALDLALGRGGDQAVVRDDHHISYYGGRLQSVEKDNKGKSRIIAIALCKLIEQSNHVFIMGHRHADMDAFGAALGIYRLCEHSETEAFIVIDEVSDSLAAVYEQVRATDGYNLISTKKARDLMEKDALAVVVDTHKPSLIEEPELLAACENVVVIDHHRRGEEFIEGPTLSYVESYASSASELVTEMLRYVVNRKELAKLEAEALLAGMTVDTNSFASRTGVRTFEAAAWLKRSGADTTEVKRFFQQDIESFRLRARAIAEVSFHDEGVATSILDGADPDAQVIAAQVADELLNIKGVKATFVAGADDHGQTCLSARSLGEINVQVLLEKMGGGGHLNTAGAQPDMGPQEAIDEVLDLLRKEKSDDHNTKTGRKRNRQGR